MTIRYGLNGRKVLAFKCFRHTQKKTVSSNQIYGFTPVSSHTRTTKTLLIPLFAIEECGEFHVETRENEIERRPTTTKTRHMRDIKTTKFLQMRFPRSCEAPGGSRANTPCVIFTELQAKLRGAANDRGDDKKPR